MIISQHLVFVKQNRTVEPVFNKKILYLYNLYIIRARKNLEKCHKAHFACPKRVAPPQHL